MNLSMFTAMILIIRFPDLTPPKLQNTDYNEASEQAFIPLSTLSSLFLKKFAAINPDLPDGIRIMPACRRQACHPGHP